MKLKVDVISMSATPIPRTLQMSLAGLRDICVIETPPEGRRPIKTYVGEYDEQMVKQALEREKARGGQAFFLHNRVEDIDEVAERLRALCPGMRFLVGHGQLEPEELEERMLAFLRGDADVLIATTIIESGIDIPQANTLIVDRADVYGLSQLYQIRGRVGRSPRARLRVPAVPERGRADRGGREPARGAVGLHRARLRLQDRHARPRAARRRQPARRRAVRPRRRARLRALHADARRGGRGDGRRGRATTSPSPCASTSTSTPTSRPTTSPTSRPRSTSTGASSPRARWPTSRSCAASSPTASAPPPEPLVNLLTLQQARIKLGQAGATAVTFRPGRLAVTPIELDSVRAKKLRAELGSGALYESGKSQFSMRVPDAPEERFPAVVGPPTPACRAARGRVGSRPCDAGSASADRARRRPRAPRARSSTASRASRPSAPAADPEIVRADAARAT